MRRVLRSKDEVRHTNTHTHHIKFHHSIPSSPRASANIGFQMLYSMPERCADTYARKLQNSEMHRSEGESENDREGPRRHNEDQDERNLYICIVGYTPRSRSYSGGSHGLHNCHLTNFAREPRGKRGIIRLTRGCHEECLDEREREREKEWKPSMWNRRFRFWYVILSHSNIPTLVRWLLPPWTFASSLVFDFLNIFIWEKWAAIIQWGIMRNLKSFIEFFLRGLFVIGNQIGKIADQYNVENFLFDGLSYFF